MMTGPQSASQFNFITFIVENQFEEAIALLEQDAILDVNFIVNLPSEGLKHVTPLMLASRDAQDKLVIAILKRGAKKIAVTDLMGGSALHYAVLGELTPERENVIRTLRFYKEDLLTLPDSLGNMPIHIVAAKGTTATMQLLLKMDSDLQYCQNEKTNQTPRDLCLQRSTPNETMLALLKSTMPSLTFKYIHAIARNQVLRTEALAALPDVMANKVALYTSPVIKIVTQIKNNG